MKTFVITIFQFMCALVLAVDVTDTWKVQALKDFTARSPMTQVLPSDEWELATLFYDLDQDGKCELLVADTMRMDRMGFDWTFCRFDAKGNLATTNDVELCCRPESFYEICFDGGARSCLAREADCIQEGKAPECRSTILLGVSPSCKLRMRKLSVGIEKMILNPGFKHLERLWPELYVEYTIKRSPPSWVVESDVDEVRRQIASHVWPPKVYDDFLEYRRRHLQSIMRANGKQAPVQVHDKAVYRLYRLNRSPSLCFFTRQGGQVVVNIFSAEQNEPVEQISLNDLVETYHFYRLEKVPLDVRNEKKE